MALIGLPLSFFIINYNGEILKLYDAFFVPEKREDRVREKSVMRFD